MKHIMKMSLPERVKLLKESCDRMIKDLISYIEKNADEPFLQNHVFGKCIEIRNRYNLLRDSEIYLNLLDTYPDMKFFYVGRRFENFHQFPGSIVGFTEKVKNIVNQVTLCSDDDYYYASPFISFGDENVEVHACYLLTFKIMPCEADMNQIKDNQTSKNWQREFINFGFPSHIIDQTKRRIIECRQSVAGGPEVLAPLIGAVFGPFIIYRKEIDIMSFD